MSVLTRVIYDPKKITPKKEMLSAAHFPNTFITDKVAWIYRNGFKITGMKRTRKFHSVPMLSGLTSEY